MCQRVRFGFDTLQVGRDLAQSGFQGDPYDAMTGPSVPFEGLAQHPGERFQHPRLILELVSSKRVPGGRPVSGGLAP